MEYLSCGNLATCTDITLSESLEAIRQCLEGLEYIHGYDIMHRDIKSDNIALESRNPLKVKLIDFGMAVQQSRAIDRVGAVDFLAPEVWNQQLYTNAIDIWALGITLLQLLRLFPSRDATEFHITQDLGRFVEAISRSVKSVPEPLRNYLRGMLALYPEYRWPARKCLAKLRTVVQHYEGIRD